MSYVLRDYQCNAVEACMNFFKYRAGLNGYVTAPGGAGKCFRKGTPIMLSDGNIIAVEHVESAMQVMGVNGQPLTVGKVCTGIEEMYEIRPRKGDSYFVNKSHILSLKKTRERKNARFNGDAAHQETVRHSIVNISVEDFLEKTKHFRHIHMGWRSSVDFRNKNNFVIPPYLLGIWLGDGSSNCFAITTGDEEIKKYLSEFARSIGLKYSESSIKSGCVRAAITCFSNKEKKQTILPKELRKLNVFSNKHIPHCYKTSSEDDRLNLLAGIIDTDGSLTKGSCYDICLVNEKLLDDIIYIARSLGFSAYKRECRKKCYNNGAIGTYYRTCISGDVNRIPCRIPHKIASPRKQKKDPLVFGFDVIPAGTEKYYGFEIIGNNKLFLLGDFTVTHNSHMIAAVAERIHDMNVGNVVVLARSEKLLSQNHAKFAPQYHDEIGIYCAGLESKDLTKPITIASAQSIAGQSIRGVAAILVDECDEINAGDEESQYMAFFKACGNPPILGFTATNFRTGSGVITWGEEIMRIPLKAIMDAGYLTPPTNKVGTILDLSDVRINLGEYVQSQLDEVYSDPDLLALSVRKIKQYSAERSSVLIFCQSLRHADILANAMEFNGMPCTIVSGDTDKDDLGFILDDFDEGRIKYLLNVMLLTRGYDMPCVDMIVLLCSTKSKRKFEQILFRGTRLKEGKRDFLVLDMGNNFQEHGPLGSPYRGAAGKGTDAYQGKICPVCEDYVDAPNARECVSCGHQFPEPERPLVNHSRKEDTTSNPVYTGDIITYDVTHVTYKQHKSKNGNETLRVDYHCPAADRYGKISEWLSPMSDNQWARSKAEQFFKERGNELGASINTYAWDDLLFHASQLRAPTRITVDHSGEFSRIKKYEWRPLSELLLETQQPHLTLEEQLGEDQNQW